MEDSGGKKKLPLPEQSLENARRLRSEMTGSEARLWYFLRAARFQGLKFRRQMPLPPYILDFCCMEKNLVIELDGGHHAQKQSADEQRTAYLRSKGFTVLRFWNNDVLTNTPAVLEQIRLVIEAQPLSPAPLPEGEGR